MRNISFAKTTHQIRCRTKSVTRRLSWLDLKPGELLRAVVQAMGIPKGQSIEPLDIIRVISVRREPLDAIDQADVIAEGFPEMTPDEFVGFFCEEIGSEPQTTVTRIEFRFLPGGRCA